jgi:anti-sigma regulatory factor (Ser/Thr protein kinase)
MLQDPEEILKLEVPCTPQAASIVRNAMEDLEGLGWILGDAMLVASELVNNGVMHSGCDSRQTLQIRVLRDGDGIVISARDPGCSGRRVAALDQTIEVDGGLGLVIVDALARRWGSERRGGYRVWAELAADIVPPV